MRCGADSKGPALMKLHYKCQNAQFSWLVALVCDARCGTSNQKKLCEFVQSKTCT